jgi:hypothetical protein
MLIKLGNTTASRSTGVTWRLFTHASKKTRRMHAADIIATDLGAVQYICMHEAAYTVEQSAMQVKSICSETPSTGLAASYRRSV